MCLKVGMHVTKRELYTRDETFSALIQKLLTMSKEQHTDNINLSQFTWAQFMDYLLRVVPVFATDPDNKDKKTLKFIPRLVSLPANVICDLIFALIKNQYQIPRLCLDLLHKSLENLSSSDLNLWTTLLLAELYYRENIDRSHLSLITEKPFYTDTVTIKNGEILVKNKNISPSDIYGICSEHKSILAEAISYIDVQCREACNTSKNEKKPNVKNRSGLYCETDYILIEDDEPEVATGKKDTFKRFRSLADVDTSVDDPDTKRLKHGDIKTSFVPQEIDLSLHESHLSLSHSILSSQMSHLVANCPIANYDGSILTRSQLVNLAAIKEAWKESKSPKDVTDVLRIFQEASVQEMEEMCNVLEVSDLPDSSLSTAVSHIKHLVGAISLACVHVFTMAAFSQKFTDQSESISRSVQCTFLSHAATFPQSTIDTVIVPAMKNGLSTSQSDSFCHVVSEAFKTESRRRLLQNMIESACVINDAFFTLLASLLSEKADITGSCLDRLVSLLETESLNRSSDLKFAKLLILLIKNYSLQFTSQQTSSIALIAAHNKTFLKKSLQSSISKLQ